jgi:predicted component of type VI protein secretion system
MALTLDAIVPIELTYYELAHIEASIHTLLANLRVPASFGNHDFDDKIFALEALAEKVEIAFDKILAAHGLD